MATRISIDPVTRIEGHLKIDCEVDGGRVTKAWSSGQMWRGIEVILKGKDPREAWLYTQRICGVCTTVHAIASVRSVENALNLEVPRNAQYLRNIMIAAHAIQDHIVHFYHLSALDWVDVTSALKADPKKTAALAQNISNWPMNSAQAFTDAQDKIKATVDSGQLGIFTNGYWGHPAMKLPPEVNLLAVTHYLQALDIQRKANMIVSILGGKTPHIQNLAVGGVANPINTDSPSTLTVERLYYLKTLIDELGSFVEEVYFQDVCAIAAHYPDWTNYGAGVTDYLSVPEFPVDAAGTVFDHPGGFLPGGDLSSFHQIKNMKDGFVRDGIQESVKHAWYQGDASRPPWEGETEPHYTDFQDHGKYSWVKAPTFQGKPAQVGPLANVLCMYAAGHARTRRYTDRALSAIGTMVGGEVPIKALHSTLGRHAARAVRTAVLKDTLKDQWQYLMESIGNGDNRTFNPPEFPKGERKGVGFHEAPRGVLSHWIVIKDGKIKNYQAVVPSTWNASPRNGQDVPGPYEASLIGTPVADPEKPLEVLRTVHSFDPCLACAVHMIDPQQKELVRIRVR
ncbi:nickel-dependent hydrogenase large subunit [Geomesophilobacter sediminis]|uniref:Nickel-dependent hydrogenase large subunit n=1 Tax=Geomesophilobacter sediminis TaxID=2798584 RepID=A0A8J7S8R6_9BACT|nr:nickel-dependent hydrogenase large subunit [Geomesophilobacter sediminis]MBJ6727811.1 nickel-dependent hydrogenase large subunit [Geomesophilobacter sediminis]